MRRREPSSTNEDQPRLNLLCEILSQQQPDAAKPARNQVDAFLAQTSEPLLARAEAQRFERLNPAVSVSQRDDGFLRAADNFFRELFEQTVSGVFAAKAANVDAPARNVLELLWHHPARPEYRRLLRVNLILLHHLEQITGNHREPDRRVAALPDERLCEIEQTSILASSGVL